MSKEFIASALFFVIVAGRTYGGECTGTLRVTTRSGESEVRTNEVRCPEGVAADLQKQYGLARVPQFGSWSYTEGGPELRSEENSAEHIERRIEFDSYDRTAEVTTRVRDLHVRGETSCANGMLIHQELATRTSHGFVSGLSVRPGCHIISATLEWWAYTVEPPN